MTDIGDAQLYEAKLIIRGQKVGAQNGATYSRMHTASEEVATIAAAASRRDAHEAANSAASAFPQWSQTPDDERSRILNKASLAISVVGREGKFLVERRAFLCIYR